MNERNGAVTTYNMKMAMFDVSDLSNPKELFKIDIGNRWTYSEVLYNHKALFYNKSKDLIGFQANWSNTDYGRDYTSGLMLFKIDLENNRFIDYDNLMETGHDRYEYKIKRAIYIENTLYTFSPVRIKSYNLDTLEELKTLDLNYDNEYYNYID